MFTLTNGAKFNLIAQLKTGERLQNHLFKYLLALYKAIAPKIPVMTKAISITVVTMQVRDHNFKIIFSKQESKASCWMMGNQ